MPRLLLIHWNEAEARSRLAELRGHGFAADRLAPRNGGALRELQAAPPDVFVIDLDRIPSQGRAVAVVLRKQKGTRMVPIVFAGGEPDKEARARNILPDAVFTEWPDIADAVRRAVKQAPAKPVVPRDIDDYSGTPLEKKLGVGSDTVFALVGAPPGFRLATGVLAPPRARNAARVLLFARSARDLDRQFERAAARLKPGGGLWIVWPKKASGIATDLTEQAVRDYGLAAGWVDYKICAVDRTWSGLLFASRSSEPR